MARNFIFSRSGSGDLFGRWKDPKRFGREGSKSVTLYTEKILWNSISLWFSYLGQTKKKWNASSTGSPHDLQVVSCVEILLESKDARPNFPDFILVIIVSVCRESNLKGFGAGSKIGLEFANKKRPVVDAAQLVLALAKAALRISLKVGARGWKMHESNLEAELAALAPDLPFHLRVRFPRSHSGRGTSRILGARGNYL